MTGPEIEGNQWPARGRSPLGLGWAMWTMLVLVGLILAASFYVFLTAPGRAPHTGEWIHPAADTVQHEEGPGWGCVRMHIPLPVMEVVLHYSTQMRLGTQGDPAFGGISFARFLFKHLRTEHGRISLVRTNGQRASTFMMRQDRDVLFIHVTPGEGREDSEVMVLAVRPREWDTLSGPTGLLIPFANLAYPRAKEGGSGGTSRLLSHNFSTTDPPAAVLDHYRTPWVAGLLGGAPADTGRVSRVFSLGGTTNGGPQVWLGMGQSDIPNVLVWPAPDEGRTYFTVTNVR